MDIKNTDLYNELINRESNYVVNVDKVYLQAKTFLPKINQVFSNYTGHGIEHSLNVMKYMFDLIDNVSDLSDLEITCLIYCALLHDIGMVVTENEIRGIKEDKLIFNGRKYSAIHKIIPSEIECIQECVRPVHGVRSYEFIMKHMDGALFLIPGYTACSFQKEVAEICQAHTMDLEYVKRLKKEDEKGEDRLNEQYIAMLLRISDYIDIDEKRAPLELYKVLSPFGYSDDEWKQHYIISNRNKIETCAENRKKIVLYGQCKEPKIYNKFLQYLDNVTTEIQWWNSYSRDAFEPIYRLSLESKIENKIEPIGFKISNLKLNMDYKAIINLLMGERVYGNKKYGLRELIQNSLDACKVMQEYAPQMECYKYDEYVPKIQIILDYDNNQIRIRDNGIGMSEEVLKKYFLNIGKSYYKSNEYIYQGNKYNPIGNFGIGFLACFMLSKEVVVETRSFKEEKGYALEIYADSEYICQKESDSFRNTFGTMVSLNLDAALSVFDSDVKKLISFLKTTFLTQDIDMYVEKIKFGEPKSSYKVALGDYEKMKEGKCCLDEYFDNISYAIEIKCVPQLKKMFSELELDSNVFSGAPTVYKYNENTKELKETDIEFAEFKHYLHENKLMIIKIEGLKKECKDKYRELKDFYTDSIFLRQELRKWHQTIIFPIKYREEFLHLFDDAWMANETIKWNFITKQNSALIKSEFDDVIKQCEFLEDESAFSVGLGIVSLLEVGQNGYLELKAFTNHSVSDNNEPDIYWRGIRLEKASIPVDIDVKGVDLGNYCMNINNKNIIPIISRDDLSSNDKERIHSQMEVAVYKHIINTIGDKDIADAIEKHARESLEL